VIATAGRKVSPEEVESVLRSHPGVGDAVVVARRSGEFERVVALVVARRELAASELLGFCAERLAAWKVPAQVEFRAALPRGASGKLLRERIA
jgi:acyl-CoA synthetase (AMP-forming)/AMP-acid ligase II